MPTPDPKVNHQGATTVSSWRAITPDDDTDLPLGVASALYVGTAGDLVVRGEDGEVATFAAYGPGWFPGRVTRVMEATTADDIVAVY